MRRLFLALLAAKAAKVGVLTYPQYFKERGMIHRGSAATGSQKNTKARAKISLSAFC